MQHELNLVLLPKQASAQQYYLPVAASKLNINKNQITGISIISKSVDARSKTVKINLKVKVYVDEQPQPTPKIQINYNNVTHKKPVIIVGAGPAGFFAALKLIELGIKPIIIERGKDVVSRKRDIAAIHRNLGVNNNSNYGFGEGGAGTYSDGKLFTRSKKRGNVSAFFELLYSLGAPQNILIDAHPHIGSDKLPAIMQNIRQTIIEHGGQVIFNTSFKKLVIKNNSVTGIETLTGEIIDANAVVLATGHSARDVYYSLHEQGIALEAKPFAMGVRIEHPQELIDSIQYSCKQRGPYLPAATYSLVTQVQNRGVYSFCMCPGGVVVPASTSNNELVVNGMSPSNRNTRWANSGIVTELQLADTGVNDINSAIKNLEYQIAYEKLSFENGGTGQIAPAQKVTDFLNKRVTDNLPESSYRPGLFASPMHQWIPPIIANRLTYGLKLFDNKMHGFITNQALLIGVESRTSSPIRIPRNPETLQHIQINGLYPCGEGAGYAGGIASSAIDGQNCAIKVADFLSNK